MANRNDNTPVRPGLSRQLIIAIIVGIVLIALVVTAVIVGSVNSGRASSPAGDSNSQGTDAGGSPLPADSAGAPSVAGPTVDPADPDQPLEQSPVPLASPATVAPGLSASVSDITAIDGVADGVGEVGGPSLKFTVSATNSGTDAVPLNTAVVGLTYGTALTPSNELVSAQVALPGEVAPGATVTGTYVFVVPVEARGDIRITLDYRAGSPIAVFAGAVSN